MTDAFLQELGQDWRREVPPVAIRRLRRQRLLSNLSFAAELAGAAVSVLVGAWLLWRGLPVYSTLGRLGGAVLVTAPPVLAAASWLIRRGQPALEDETAESVLLYTLRRLRMVRLLNWVGAAHGYVLAVLAMAIWLSAAIGWSPRDWVIGAYGAFYLVIAVVFLARVEKRSRSIAREREGCEALLERFRRESA